MNHPIETPVGKLIREVLTQVEKARVDLINKNQVGALVEIEYVSTIVDDLFAQYPELKNVLYTR